MTSPTMTLIASQTVGSGGASSVTFSSIPNTYNDLYIYASTRDTTSGVVGNTLVAAFNGSTTGIYAFVLSGGGSSPGVGSYAFGRDIGADTSGSATANTFSNNYIYISNYASTTAYKSYMLNRGLENNATEDYNYIVTGVWQSTSALNSITFSPSGSSSFVQYTTFYIYGV